VLHSLRNSTSENKRRLWEILHMKTKDSVLIDEAIALLNLTKSIEYSRVVASKIVADAWD